MSRRPRPPGYLPVPDVDHHVVLVTHADDVFPVGRKRHTGDAIFVLLQLGDLKMLRNIPDANRWHVTALGGGDSITEAVTDFVARIILMFQLKNIYLFRPLSGPAGTSTSAVHLTSPVTIYFPSGEKAKVVTAFLESTKKRSVCV